jgi:hypothetical protein
MSAIDIKSTIAEIMMLKSDSDPMLLVSAIGKMLQAVPMMFDDKAVIDDELMLSLNQDDRKKALAGMMCCHLETLKK